MPSQNRNLLLFFLSFLVIMAGSTWLRTKLWPPPPGITPEQRAEFFQAEPDIRLATFPTGTGLGDAVGLAIQSAVTRQSASDYAVAARAARAEELAKAPPPPPAPAPKPDEKVDLVTLGGDGYHLSVTFTPRGAGIERLVLSVRDEKGVPVYKQADYYGLPVLEDGKPKPLELLPASPTRPPSFALFHYARADAEEKFPLDTLGNRVWSATPKKSGEEQSVAFSTDLAEHGVRIIKTFTLRPKEYHVGLTVRVERLPGATATTPFRYQLMGGRQLPIEGEWYTTTYRNAMVGLVEKNGTLHRILEDSGTLSHASGGERVKRNDMTIQYAAVAIQYFVSAIVVDDQQPRRDFLEFVRNTVEFTTDSKKPYLDDITTRAIAEPLDLKPGESAEHKYMLYHGPVKVRLLDQLRGEATVAPELVHRYEETLHLNSLTDYGRWGFWTNAIVFFTNLVHTLIGWLRRFSPNDGLCIILVTVIVRGLMFPLSRKQAATMSRTQEQMAKVAPEVKKIKEKHKGDMVAQQQAMSELYRRNGINPAAGLGGCLMLFAQMPIFLGLYFALQESFFFRLERFLWVRNLTAPDMLIWWGEKIPWISDPAAQGGLLYLGPYFNILPVLAVALMVIQQQLTMPPAADEQQEMQQKMMKYMMIVFGLMFYKMPSGLCIYFIASTAWGLIERKLTKKKPAAGDAMPAKAAAGPNGKPGPRGKTRGKGQPEAPQSKFKEWWEKVLKEASKK